jgi:hypothetical protein
VETSLISMGRVVVERVKGHLPGRPCLPAMASRLPRLSRARGVEDLLVPRGPGASADEARRRVLAAGTPLDMERVRAQSVYPKSLKYALSTSLRDSTRA